MQYTNVPQTEGITTLQGAVDLLNYFDVAYQSNLSDPNNVNVANFAALTKHALILADTNENPSMFGMINMMFGAKEEMVNARQIFRKTQNRFQYTFQIAQAATTGVPGGEVTIQIAPQSHFLNGTSSMGQPGNMITLPDFNNVQILSKDTSVNYAHTMVVAPFDPTYIIDLPANQTLIPTLARLDGDESCAVNGTGINIPGIISKAYMGKTRYDWAIQKSINKGYDGILQFALGYIDGQEVECWQPLVVTLMRRYMRMTKDRLMFVGQTFYNNPSISVTVEGFQGFQGYIPSILYAGGNDNPYDSLTGFDPQNDLAQIVRFANANKRTKEYIFFMSKEFKIQFISNMNTIINSNPGSCTFDSFKRMAGSFGGKTESVVEFLGVDSYKLYGYTFHLIEVQEWSDPMMYGADGYPYRTMGIIMPATPIPTSDGGTVAPIEVFVPYGCADSGSYREYWVDEETLAGGCQQISGHATEEFSAMFHVLEDHTLVYDNTAL